MLQLNIRRTTSCYRRGRSRRARQPARITHRRDTCAKARSHSAGDTTAVDSNKDLRLRALLHDAPAKPTDALWDLCRLRHLTVHGRSRPRAGSEDAEADPDRGRPATELWGARSVLLANGDGEHNTVAMR